MKHCDVYAIVRAGEREIRVPTGLFLGGEFVAGSSGESFSVIDASTSLPIVDVASASEDDARRALDTAVSVQEEWAESSPKERSEVLWRAFELVMEHVDELSALQSLELGRALPDSRSEVAYGAEYFRWFSQQAMAVRGDYRVPPSGVGRVVTHHRPMGPVLAITPWNFPLAMIARKVAPAIAAGCTVIVKPAQMTPLTALYLGELLQKAGVPDGVVQVVPTGSAKNVSVLLGDDRLRKLTFTGSTEVGQMLAATAMEKTIRTSLELGGNAPFVVLEHADVDKAVTEAVTAKMRGAGQVCVAGNRYVVHESVVEEFTTGVVKKMSEFVMGPGVQEGVTMGALVSANERDKVKGLVERAVDDGAVVELGGPDALARLGETHPELDPRGFWYPPTVLSRVTPEFEIARTEIFGPVVAIQTFTDEEEALRIANDTPFGLAAYVCGEKLAETLRFAEKMEAGMVAVNRGALSDATAPFGGVKQSGIGREGGFEGIDEYLETVYIALPG
ncbi:NAD-dependent succinate-semialdehyde dehydrogenase [Corynebacterium anserum]|uniref:Aldehyde dehydrogenase family protein n=1 Tax=Corynebacterium anserum TaxID=2684406 RepID=A0A7G7YMB9_9CORY|nr:NAD-dependent succinate-semialdehyde dehydrogenase [Corynebacterium anserum]MBC2680999.1 aldehyde dehydrogenase family protein [Corynebacterium anserum]QNH95639.1 aldehyde dehydrogenase family protein [Corynebacterium anserum]